MRRAGQLRMGLVLAASVVTLSALGGPALAQDYVIEHLLSGAPGGWCYCGAEGIGNAGQVVGTVWRDDDKYGHAFIWTAEGGVQELEGLGEFSLGSQAYGINDAGQVVGALRASNDRACVWTAGGEVQALSLPPGATGSGASSINNLGQVVGQAWTSLSYSSRATLWSPGGSMQDLGCLPGQHESSASGINDSGQVVGMSGTPWYPHGAHAFLWTPGEGMRELGTLGGPASEALSINEFGWVVGWSWIASWASHACLWTPDGAIRDLGTHPGGSWSYAESVNNMGQVVGRSGSSDGSEHAFLWTAEGGMVDLGTSWAGGRSAALDINDAGEIAGWEVDPHNGQFWACRWRPATPTVLIEGLVTWVADLNLQAGIDNSLDAKLGCALGALNDVNANNDVAAVNALGAFINAVEAQRGQKISEADADTLIAKALRIIAALGG